MILMTEEEEEGKREIRGKKGGGIGTLDQDQWWELGILLS